MSRSNSLSFVIVGTLIALAAGLESAEAANSPLLLRSARQPGSVDRVVSVLEVSGTSKAPHKDKTEESKLGVKATMVYDERTLEVPNAAKGALRSVRYYDGAEARIDLAKGTLTPRLNPDHRLMAVAIEDAQVTLFSPQGRLTRDELDLVNSLANSLLLDRFLPAKPVSQGDAWSHPDDLVRAAFGLDRTAKQTVTSKLVKLDDAAAVMELSGEIDGAINGVTTRIDVKGKYRFNRKTKRIDWFGLLVHEDRDVGHVGPGVNVVARLRIQIDPRESSEHLTDEAIEGLALEPTDELTQLVYKPEQGGWRFGHGRRWFETGSDQELGFLRLIEQGDFVAQCNVANLAPVEPGKQATLEQFQEDIQKALGDDFGEFVSAGQKANEQDYRVLRVVARGTVSGLPIEWHYYLVADEHGRQVTFTFTVEGPLAKRLGEVDREIVGSLRFDPPKVASREETSRQ